MKLVTYARGEQERIGALDAAGRVVDLQRAYEDYVRAARSCPGAGELAQATLGRNMVEFLRRRTETKELPIVMLSSEATDVIVDQALALGADSYVMKPVTIEELEKAMANAFYKHLPQ